MENNLVLYNQFRKPPKEALRNIAAGRLKGKTDINPMWRLKALTEAFGPCGIGWKYTIERQWLEVGIPFTFKDGNGQIISGNEISAFCNILLYYKYNGEWSEGIPGNGGAAFIALERSGPHTSDECYKMALTDALSVAAKALGIATDVYWDKDPTKYSAIEERQAPRKASSAPAAQQAKQRVPAAQMISRQQQEELMKLAHDAGCTLNQVMGRARKMYPNAAPQTIGDLTPEQYMQISKILSEHIAQTKEAV